MPDAQIHFDLATSGGKPVVDGREVDAFIRWLSGKGWITRREIESRTSWNDRRQRTLAEASAGHILSGQRGYRLTCQATPEERDECLRRLRGQRNAMARRIKDIFNVHLRNKIPRCLR